jgi:hypothetical protein
VVCAEGCDLRGKFRNRNSIGLHAANQDGRSSMAKDGRARHRANAVCVDRVAEVGCGFIPITLEITQSPRMILHCHSTRPATCVHFIVPRSVLFCQVREPVLFIDMERQIIVPSVMPTIPVASSQNVEDPCTNLSNHASVIKTCETIVGVDCLVLCAVLH